MLNKKIKERFKSYKLISSETMLFFFSSMILFILKLLLFNISNTNMSYLVLLVLVTIFGLPHGALDTLLAKRFKIYFNTLSFIIFNLTYLIIGLTVFLFWNFYPILALYLFLGISAYHFSEDWKSDLVFYERFVLGLAVINLPLFFHAEEVNLIYNYVTNDNNVILYSKIQYTLAKINLFLLGLLALKKIKLLNIFSQISMIFIFSYALDPIYFFIAYFCFFHSIKNYKESVNYLHTESKHKINSVVLINTIITIFLGIIFYYIFFKTFNVENLSIIIFIGLAALTVPHMLLKFIISKRKF